MYLYSFLNVLSNAALHGSTLGIIELLLAIELVHSEPLLVVVALYFASLIAGRSRGYRVEVR